jgi:hypothetical protein
MLIGTEGIYSYTFEHEKRDDCPVCGGEALELSISSELTVEQLIEMLVEKQDMQAANSLLISSDILIRALQSNQETIPLDPDSADLPASSAPARTSYAAQPNEKGDGACTVRRRGHCHSIHFALQLVPTNQLYIDSTHVNHNLNLFAITVPRLVSMSQIRPVGHRYIIQTLPKSPSPLPPPAATSHASSSGHPASNRTDNSSVWCSPSSSTSNSGGNGGVLSCGADVDQVGRGRTAMTGGSAIDFAVTGEGGGPKGVTIECRRECVP